MTVSFVLKLRERDLALYQNPALPTPPGTMGGAYPKRIRSLFSARNGWKSGTMYLIKPGGRNDYELQTLDDATGAVVDVFGPVTWQVYNADGTSYAGQSGAALWESTGTYVMQWNAPAGLNPGDVYAVEFTVGIDANGGVEKIRFPLRVRGVVL